MIVFNKFRVKLRFVVLVFVLLVSRIISQPSGGTGDKLHSKHLA